MGDKATSVSDTNMAQCQQQYYVYAPSFSASHRATALHLPHLTLPPAHPSASSACTQTLSAAILAYKGGASAPSASSLCGSLGSRFGFFFFFSLLG